MSAQRLVEILLDVRLDEASIRLPSRGTICMAVYTGPEGGQVWRSTGLRDRDEALALANKWAAEARAQRQAFNQRRQKASIRVRRSNHNEPGELSQKEVAAILQISERAVREIECRAFQKLPTIPY